MKNTCTCNGRNRAVIGMSHEIYGEVNTLRLTAESDDEYGRNFAKFFTPCGSVMKAQLPAKALSH